MEKFRPSYRPANGDGRNCEIVDANMLKYINKVYFGRRSQPSFDPPPFDQKQVDKERKKRSSSIESWWNEPRMKRKRRLAKYKMLALEGKLRCSLKKGRRWIKKKYCKIVHGY